MNKDEIINVALAADGGYFCGLFVTACSIAKYAAKDVTLRFNILDGGIKEDDWNLLENSVVRLHSKIGFRRFKITKELFKDFLLWHGNHMTYARLLLPELLKDEDYCIYCDVDFLWMRDVAELWSMRREDTALISTWDGTKATWDIDGVWLKEKEFDFSPDDYFCAGLTFFNLRYFRDNDLHKKCFELLKLKPPFNDQTVLYIATKGKSLLVSEIWQRFSERLSNDEYKRGAVIHYAGAVPWKKKDNKIALLRDVDLLWHKMNADARGISLWRSLRMYFGPVHIFWHRGLRDVLYWLNRIHCLGWLKVLLEKSGHVGLWRNIHIGISLCR